MVEPLSTAEVVRQIDKLETYINTHKSTIPSRLYDAMDGASRTFLAYKESEGTPGWAKTVKQSNGSPIWNTKEADVLEELVESTVRHQSLQEGGAQIPVPTPGPKLHVTPASTMVTLPDAATFSLDEVFEGAREYIKSIDTKNRELASILGPVAIVKSLSNGYTEDVHVPLLFPFPPFTKTIQIPSRMVIPMFQSVLETCRLLVSNSLIDIEFLRKIFSFIIAIFDITSGEWKNGILSFMGYFGKEQMLIGQSLKTAKWIYNFISPDIQDRIEDDLIAGGKSMLAGSILWFVSIVSPGPIQGAINKMLETARQPVEELNQKFEEIQKTAQESAAKIGAKVVFPKFPLANFPSFDDIQNFQSLIHQPEVFCSTKFQEVLADSIKVPVLRVLLELMNVPTLPEAVTEKCRGQSATIEESLLKSMIPTVTMPNATPTATLFGGMAPIKMLGTAVGLGTAAIPASQKILYKYYVDDTYQPADAEEENKSKEKPKPMLNKETPKKIAEVLGPVLQLGTKGVELGAKGVSMASKQTEFIEDKLSDLEEGLVAAESVITDRMEEALPLVEHTVGVVRPVLGPLVGTIDSTATTAVNVAEDAGNLAGNVAEDAGNFAGDMADQFAPAVTKLVKAGKNISGTASNMVKNSVNMTKTVVNTSKPVVESAVKSTKQAAVYLEPSGKNLVRGVQPVINVAEDTIVSTIDTVTDDYIKPIKNTVESTIEETSKTIGPSQNNAIKAIVKSSKNIKSLQKTLKKSSNSGEKLGDETEKLQNSTSKIFESLSYIATPYTNKNKNKPNNKSTDKPTHKPNNKTKKRR
jgi:methyl-accepting chemotaxis protein